MDSDIQKKMADAVLGLPLPFSIKSNKTKEERHFTIAQPTFGLLIETSKILADIGVSEIGTMFEGKDVFKFIAKHGEKVLQIIAILLDDKINYTSDTYKYLKDNLNQLEIYDLLCHIVLRIGVQDFQKSIIGIIPISLLNQAELIALIPKKKSLTPSSL